MVKNKIKIMSEEMKAQLTDNQITFMRRMEMEIIPNRDRVDMNNLKSVGQLVGIGINTSCRTCASKGGVDMLNMYGQLKPAYNQYMFENRPIIVEEPIVKSKSKKV